MTDHDLLTCRTCRNYAEHSGVCDYARAGKMAFTSRWWKPDPDRLRRCDGYFDGKRHGIDIWPGSDHPAMKTLVNFVPSTERDKP